MTTTTRIARFRRYQPYEAPISISSSVSFRELWADGLAALATVTLLSILIFQAMGLLIP